MAEYYSTETFEQITFDQFEAIRRLDAIEKEQYELRKILNKAKTQVERDKTYIGVYMECPYIMLGVNEYAFYSGTGVGCRLAEPFKTPEECLDYHRNIGFKIHVYPNKKMALEFMVSLLK